MWGAWGKSTTRRRSSNSRLSMGAPFFLYLSLQAEHFIERRKKGPLQQDFEAMKFFCCLLSQLGPALFVRDSRLLRIWKKLPGTRPARPFRSERRKQPSRRRERTTCPRMKFHYIPLQPYWGIHMKQTGGNQRDSQRKGGNKEAFMQGKWLTLLQSFLYCL